jgi:hypothetical protein
MLFDYLNKTCSDAFEWGRNDCALWCASAVAHELGVDPAQDLRGTYSTRFECRQLIISAGGLARLVSPRMDRLNLCDLDGDGVAIIKLGALTLCGLIVNGRAIVRLESGLRVVDDFSILKGWSCRRL